MNRRLSRLISSLAGLAFSIAPVAPRSFAAAPTTASIDPSIRTSVNAGASAKTIDDFIKSQIEGLKGDDAELRKVAREALISNSTAPNAAASVQYLDAYGAALDTELLPLASHENVFIRLNVAIVAARVAANANNDRLRNVLLVLMNDKSDAVIIWALRAARYVIPAVLSNPLIAKNDKLLPSVVPVVQAHPSSSAILQEGYAALMLNYLDPNRAKPTPSIWKPMVFAAVTEVCKLLHWRLDMYKTGVPPEPLAENAAASFLVHPDIAHAQNKEQLQVSSQLVCDLMALAAVRCTAAADADKDSLLAVVKRAANSLQALATVLDPQKGRDLQPVVLPIQQANKTTQNLPALVAPACLAFQKAFPELAVVPTTLPSK